MWHPERLYDVQGHLDEGVIHAWLDGELDRDAGREVEAHAAACMTCSGRVAEARGLVAGASRILGALDAGADVGRPTGAAGPASTTDLPRAGRVQRRHGWWGTRRLSLAAAAVFLLVTGSMVLREQLGDGGVREAIVADREAAPGAGEAAGFAAVAESAAAAASDAGTDRAPAPAAATPASRVGRAAGGAAGGEAGAAGATGGIGRAVVPELANSPDAPGAARAVLPKLAKAPAASGAPAADLPKVAPAPEAREASAGGVPGVAPAPAIQESQVAGRREVASAPAAVSRVPAPAMQPAPPRRAESLEAMQQKVMSDTSMMSCWRLAGAKSILKLHPSRAPESDGWHLGERLDADTVAPIRWREEIGTAGRRLRIAEPEAIEGAGLLLLVVGDSLFEMPAGPRAAAGRWRGVRVDCSSAASRLP